MLDILDLELEIIIVITITIIPMVLIVHILMNYFKTENGLGYKVNKDYSIITIIFLFFLSLCHAIIRILRDSLHCLIENLINIRSNSKLTILKPEICINKTRGNLLNSQLNLFQLK